MDVYTVLVRWKKNSPTSQTYPSLDALRAMPTRSAAAQDWLNMIEGMTMPAGLLDYRRYSNSNGDVISASVYASQSDFDADKGSNPAFAQALPLRDALAADLDVSVTETTVVIDYQKLFTSTYDDVNALFPA